MKYGRIIRRLYTLLSLCIVLVAVTTFAYRYSTTPEPNNSIITWIANNMDFTIKDGLLGLIGIILFVIFI